MRVINITVNPRCSVILEYQGKKIEIKADGFIYFIPDFFKGSQFKGLLQEIPEHIPLKKHHPKMYETIKDPKTHVIISHVSVKDIKPEPLEAFPNDIYKPENEVFPDYDTPKNQDYFPTFIKDRDDPDVLVDSSEVMPTFTERMEELNNGEKPLKNIRVSKKLRDDIKKGKQQSSTERNKKRQAAKASRNFGEPV